MWTFSFIININGECYFAVNLKGGVSYEEDERF